MKRTDLAARYDPIYGSISDHVSNRPTASESITISCYENDVPAFIEAEMNRIYGSLYASLAQFRVYSDGRDTSTYIVRKGVTTITAFLFQHHGSNVRVVNEVIRVDEEEINRFAAYIFANFLSATVISFKSIQTNLRTLPFPYQRVNHLEDFVLTLPNTAEEYLSSLGKDTRTNIKHYAKKLLKSFPSFCFEVLAKVEIGQTVRDIIDLNRARMAGQHKVSAVDEDEMERTIRLAAECGLIVIARIDGRMCAGCICFRTGSNYFLRVIAHDPMYDDYMLGILCCYLTVCECIARGGKEFHFLWGEYEYKNTLLGVKRNLDKVTIYRSLRQMLLNGDMALNIAWRSYLRQMKLWLHNGRRRNSYK